ncbi:MAG TPA: IclR family transcriptional regulator [Microvirga sp.]|jgi:DNA-binding IclR family transcriptional regulator|nr:IclR family transcriptional regulator [Microvirga sp.]
MAQADGPYIVQPVLKALKVLEYVAEKGHEVTLTEVATELRLPKTTVFRYLQTLTAASFLHHDSARDRYGVGLRFRALAKADKSLQRLRALAQPEMAELGRTFNETINLGILAEGQVVYIDMIEANRALRMQARIGDRHPLHSTSLGKAMLAFLPEAERLSLVDGSLKAMTLRTVTSRAALRRQIEEVRRKGYAVEIGENEDGSMCIGVPIIDEGGHPLAALSLSAPERRMTREVTQNAIAALQGAAGRISVRLGAAAPAPARPRAARARA